VASVVTVKAATQIVKVHYSDHKSVHGYRPRVDSPPIDVNTDTFIHTIILRNEVHTLTCLIQRICSLLQPPLLPPPNMTSRKQPSHPTINPPIPLPINIRGLPHLRNLRKRKLISNPFLRPIRPARLQLKPAAPIGRDPLLRCPARRGRPRLFVAVFERPAADEVAHDDAQLPAVAVLEADDDHAVAAEAFAPAVDAVFLADAVRHHEFVVARHADVVVAGVAL
jgi:hypothetical protein